MHYLAIHVGAGRTGLTYDPEPRLSCGGIGVTGKGPGKPTTGGRLITDEGITGSNVVSRFLVSSPLRQGVKRRERDEFFMNCDSKLRSMNG